MSPKKKKKTKPLDLKLTLENFGPLRKAEVDLKPMTIFIGPNNSGKSYVAMMFYSLFRSYWHVDPGPPIWPPQASETGTSKALDERAFLQQPFCYDTLLTLVHNNPDFPLGKPIKVSPQVMGEVGRAIFSKVSLGPLAGELTRIYGATLEELRRFGRKRFEFIIRASDWWVMLRSHGKDVAIADLDTGFKAFENKKYRVAYWKLENGKPDAPSLERARVATLGHALATESIMPLWRQLERGCHYVPGERAGLILLATPFIRAYLHEKACLREWPQGVHLPRGVVSDFFGNIAELAGLDAGPFTDIVDKMQNELIAGAIVLRTKHKNIPPELFYRVGDREYGLHMCSSSVSELAPLVLYMKYLTHPGSLLIIDEPEAHLHPRDQSILAKYLVRLVRAGLNLIITTHSEYMLAALSNFVMLEDVKKEKRKELGFEEEDYLTRKEVGVYRFKYDRRSKGYVTERQEPTAEGIRQDEFSEIDRKLYEEEIALEAAIQEK